MAEGTPGTFFSYCREDSDFALQLAGDLRAAGANVWLDQLDILPGQRWDRAVEDALANCPHILAILSPTSVNSNNVMDEVSFALEENKTVIPVMHKDCTVPFRLRRLQYVDFRQDYARGLKELLKTLAPEQKAAPSAPVSSYVPSERRTEVAEAGERERAAEEERRKELEQDQQAQEDSKRTADLAEASAKVTARLALTLRGHSDAVWSVDWSPDSKRLASGSSDKTTKLWNVDTGQELLKLRNRECVRTVAWNRNPGTNCLATATTDGWFELWNPDTGEELHSDYGTALDPADEHGWFIAWRPYEAVDEWGDGFLAHDYSWGEGAALHYGIAVHYLMTGAATVLPYNKVVRGIAWSPDGERLVAGMLDGTARVWNVDWHTGNGFGSGTELLTLKGHSASVTSVAWDPKGSRLATGGEDGKVILWDSGDGKQLLTLILDGQPSEVWSVAWNPSSNWLATGSEDNRARVWDAETGKELLTLSGHRGAIRNVAWSPDGKRLATGSQDKTTKVWDIASSVLP